MTLPIDVRIKGIGRIQFRSGTRDRKLRDRLADMLRVLPRQGHLELVRDLKSGRRTVLEVYDHFVHDTLDQLAGPSLDVPLLSAMESWLDRFGKSAQHVQSYRDALSHLNPSRKALIRDLPYLLGEYRGACLETPRKFNVGRSMCLAFVRDTAGKHKSIYLDVQNVGSLTEAKQGRKGLPLADALQLRDTLRPNAARCWWSMCLTGMNPKEYWGRWEVLSDRIRIHGTKRIGRSRDVPLIDYPVRPELKTWGFSTAMRTTGFVPYQGRKTYGVWLDSIGLPKGRHDAYMGHGPRSMRDLYSAPEIAGFLQQDAQALRALLPQGGMRLVKS